MDKIKKFWNGLAKTVFISFFLVFLMWVAFVFGNLTVLGAIVLGTTAIVLAILGLKE